MPDPCPLCRGRDTRPYHRDRKRRYLACAACELVFVPPAEHLPAADEKAYYDLHENTVDDPGYRRFLGRLFEPMTARLTPGGSGLDFGCGPGPALAAMFREAGFDMALFDPFYAPDDEVLKRHYDFVTASEVVEHLSRPREELDRLWACLEPGGWLGIMTKRVIDAEAFAGWHYITDPTHVCFFSESTFRWLGKRWNTEPDFTGRDVVLFRRPATSA